MISRLPSASLADCPSYPNSVSWSEENFLAVAAGKLVIILNPAMPSGPRGLITLPPNKPFPIGVVTKKELLSPCLLPTCLQDAYTQCARSISWSPLGISPFGCLLAVCTVEGRVKIYISAFPEPCSEWIEVADISDMLCYHFIKTNFVHSAMYSSLNQDIEASVDYRMNELSSQENPSGASQLITAKEFTLRSALISTVAIAWSPLLHLFFDNGLHRKCSMLALGGKGGYISFWRFEEPQSSNSEHKVYAEPVFIGLIHAHSAWVTAISFELCRTDATKPQLVLASGSSDGSVKIWVMHGEQSVSSKFSSACFLPLQELTPITFNPISTISLVALDIRSNNLVLAVGRGSGALESWTCHISNGGFENAGSFHAHDKVITGLGWAFGGRCLYSCSQDHSLRCWILWEGSLSELPFPSNIHARKGASNVAQLSDPCFGLAISPGSLVMSVVHGLDSSLLNQMYEARTQKAAVEFLWMGGRPLESPLKKQLINSIDDGHTFSEKDLLYWKSDLVWSIEQFDTVDKELVVWDLMTALLSFKQSQPEIVESILCQWLSTWFTFSVDMFTENIFSSILHSLSTIKTRKLHLLNILCRRVFLDEASEGRLSGMWQGSKVDETEVGTTTTDIWEKMLVASERELLERLIAFSLKAFFYVASRSISDNCWLPSGVAQMEHWVASKPMLMSNEIKLLASKIRGLKNRLPSNDEYMPELCGYCSAPVLFEFPHIAYCSNGSSSNSFPGGPSLSRCTKDGEASCSTSRGHKLFRCSASMRVCQTATLWLCKCCKRWAENFIPEGFFNTSMSPLDDNFEISSSCLVKPSKPLCPYCGVLLQRSKPQFLLSASPV